MFECSFQRNLVASIVLGLHKKPLKSVNFRGFFLFLVYCGAEYEQIGFEGDATFKAPPFLSLFLTIKSFPNFLHMPLCVTRDCFVGTIFPFGT